jgi:hypothetical protein
LRFGTLLLDCPVLSQVHASDHTHNEQTNGRSADSDPAPEPIHEVSLRRGQ